MSICLTPTDITTKDTDMYADITPDEEASWAIHPVLLKKDDSGILPLAIYPDPKEYVYYRDHELAIFRWCQLMIQKRQQRALMSKRTVQASSLPTSEESTQRLGGTNGTAFRAQFLNLSQWNYHAVAVGPSTLSLDFEDHTEFGAQAPVWNMSMLAMAAPDMEEIYRKASNLPPWSHGSEVVYANVAVPHLSSPATVTAGKQTTFALKDAGFVPMEVLDSNLAGLSDVIQDWTGYIPLVKQKCKMRTKLNMLATLNMDTDWTSVGSYWMRIILFEHENNFLYSGFRPPSYTGAGPVDGTLGVMPQSSNGGVVTNGWSNVTAFNTINPQFAWVPYWLNQYAILDDTWLSSQIPNNTQFGGTQTPVGQTSSLPQGPALSLATQATAANPVGITSLTQPSVNIPTNGLVKVRKEHWFKFDAGSNTSGSHTWEWEQDIDYVEDFASGTNWYYGIDPAGSTFVPACKNLYLTCFHYGMSQNGVGPNQFNVPLGCLLFTVTCTIE